MPPRLIVCEKSNRWAVALRRALGRKASLLRETRSLPECQRDVVTAPASFVALEVTETNLEGALEVIQTSSQLLPNVRFAALIDPALQDASGALREAGAVYVASTTASAGEITRLALRHIALAPPEPLPLREQIWQRLPWRSRATASG